MKKRTKLEVVLFFILAVFIFGRMGLDAGHDGSGEQNETVVQTIAAVTEAELESESQTAAEIQTSAEVQTQSAAIGTETIAAAGASGDGIQQSNGQNVGKNAGQPESTAAEIAGNAAETLENSELNGNNIENTSNNSNKNEKISDNKNGKNSGSKANQSGKNQTGTGNAAAQAGTSAAVTIKQEIETDAPEAVTIAEDGSYTDKDSVALYIHTYGHLPSNYITKKKARAAGWNSSGSLSKVLPGMSIGGDKYGNYEGKLPEKDGRKYYECDIDYKKGGRNGKRIVYSNDGLIYYTGDHYETFELLYD